MKNLLLAIATVFTGLFFPSDAQSDLKDFLSKNHHEFKSEMNSNKLLDDEFYSSRYVFFGETHGFSNPQEVDFELFKSLNQKADFKYYIAEIDDAKAWGLNNYLNDGNENWLKKTFKSWVKDTAQWANQNYFDKYKQLYQLQKELPKNKKFTFIGVDQPQDYEVSNEYLNHFSGKLNKGEIKNLVQKLSSDLASGNSAEIINSSKATLDFVNKNEKQVLSALKENFIPFQNFLKNLSMIDENRDKAMFLNLENYISSNKLETAKMYGFMGTYHVMQASYNSGEPFVHLLKKKLNNAKITSLVGFYTDSNMMMPYMGQLKMMIPGEYAGQLWQAYPDFGKSKKYLPVPFSNNQSNPVMEKVEHIEYLEELSSENSATLFKLSGKNSPFNAQNTFAEVKGMMGITLTNPDDKTTDAFQYLILFRNALPGIPLEM